MRISSQQRKEVSLNSDRTDPKNIKAALSSGAEIELKFIAVSDFIKLESLIHNERITNKQFLIRVLKQQAVTSEDTELEQLSDQELRATAIAFMKHENILPHYRNTENFYSDFRDSITAYIIAEQKRLAEIMDRSIRTYCNKVFPDVSKVISEMSKAFSGIGESIQEAARKIVKFDLSRLGSAIGEHLKTFEETDYRASRALKRYHWFICPSMPVNICFGAAKLADRTGRYDKEINWLFIEYFSRDNWYSLEKMATGWKDRSILGRRYKILIDCVHTLQKLDGENINGANVVLPTLIIQIDGILTDYLEQKGISWSKLYYSRSEEGRLDHLRNILEVQISSNLEIATHEILLDTLFQNYDHSSNTLTRPFNFNRHKIIHGKSISYGRRDYLVRAFMLIDLLSYLQ